MHNTMAIVKLHFLNLEPMVVSNCIIFENDRLCLKSSYNELLFALVTKVNQWYVWYHLIPRTDCAKM
jgi:hypothetical protein